MRWKPAYIAGLGSVAKVPGLSGNFDDHVRKRRRDSTVLVVSRAFSEHPQELLRVPFQFNDICHRIILPYFAIGRKECAFRARSALPTVLQATMRPLLDNRTIA